MYVSSEFMSSLFVFTDCRQAFIFRTTERTRISSLPEKIKAQRTEKLMLAQQETAFAKNKQHIGRKLTCLIDQRDNNDTGLGRFYGQAPQIDSICYIDNCSADPGEFIRTKVLQTQDYDLIVEQIYD